jgi:hypothetical protein
VCKSQMDVSVLDDDDLDKLYKFAYSKANRPSNTLNVTDYWLSLAALANDEQRRRIKKAKS